MGQNDASRATMPCLKYACPALYQGYFAFARDTHNLRDSEDHHIQKLTCAKSGNIFGRNVTT